MNNRLNYLNWRFILIAFAIFVCLIAIFYKILSIQFFESNFLQNEGNKRYVKYKDVVPVRGTIYDRNNFPLAVSVINYDLYALRGFTKSQLLNISEKVDLDIDPGIEVFNKKTLIKKNISNEQLKPYEKNILFFAGAYTIPKEGFELTINAAFKVYSFFLLI